MRTSSLSSLPCSHHTPSLPLLLAAIARRMFSTQHNLKLRPKGGKKRFPTLSVLSRLQSKPRNLISYVVHGVHHGDEALPRYNWTFYTRAQLPSTMTASSRPKLHLRHQLFDSTPRLLHGQGTKNTPYINPSSAMVSSIKLNRRQRKFHGETLCCRHFLCFQ